MTRTAVIGEFAPPHDAVTLFNLRLVDDLRAEAVSSRDVTELAERGLIRFRRGVIDLLRGRDRLIYLTRLYDRRSLLHLYVALVTVRRRCRRIELVLHSELFSFLGPLRSRHVGAPMLRSCLSRVDVVTCGDERTAAVLRDLAGPSCEIRVDRLRIAMEETTADRDLPLVVVSCDRESGRLVDEANRLRDMMSSRSDEPISVMALAYDCDTIDRASVDVVVENPSPAEAARAFAGARAIVRPLRCMGTIQFPDDWFMLEQPDMCDRLDLSDGIVILRRPPAGADADPVVDRVASEVAATRPDSVVFVGVCDGPSAEAQVNRALLARWQRAGIEVRTLSLPGDGFDGKTVGSYVDFVRRMWTTIDHDSAVVCATQGYTRPSLLLLLTASALSRQCHTGLSVVLHPEMFDFFARLRSRNAGLPLLFTTFTLARAVYGTPSSCEIARRYKHAPGKFREVSFPTPRVDDDAGPPAPSWLVDFARTTRNGIAGAVARPLACDGVTVSKEDVALFVDAYNAQREVVDRLVVITKGSADLHGTRFAQSSIGPIDRFELDVERNFVSPGGSRSRGRNR